MSTQFVSKKSIRFLGLFLLPWMMISGCAKDKCDKFCEKMEECGGEHISDCADQCRADRSEEMACVLNDCGTSWSCEDYVFCALECIFGGSDSDSDTDTDTDTDSDSDSDSDTDTDADGDCDFPNTFEEKIGAYNEEYDFVAYQAWNGYSTSFIDQFFSIEMFGDIEPGTYDLDGYETSLETCENCVFFYEGVTVSDGLLKNPDRAFMPSDGTLEITAVSPEVGKTFSGTVSATLVEVTIDGETLETTTVPGGCTMDINHSFSVILQSWE